jgi:hypothetical protein
MGGGYGVFSVFWVLAGAIVNLKKLNTGNIHFGLAGIRLSNYLGSFISQ